MAGGYYKQKDVGDHWMHGAAQWLFMAAAVILIVKVATDLAVEVCILLEKRRRRLQNLAWKEPLVGDAVPLSSYKGAEHQGGSLPSLRGSMQSEAAEEMFDSRIGSRRLSHATWPLLNDMTAGTGERRMSLGPRAVQGQGRRVQSHGVSRTLSFVSTRSSGIERLEEAQQHLHWSRI
eukprot:TRINITY_DN3362_c1_g2_i1.p1 TRINITY_DN3362_c1_g2~~TRINITY_DN3362_c1_g2_i1.p1  ORF type:complete len:177 (+),score=38.34 TRINITY_DN3362_c1_g2_i1:3-533(+)